MTRGKNQIDEFDFRPGRIVGSKYEIVGLLGSGWESEVYIIRERDTKIERAAKFFFPQRNIKEHASRRHARKLHKLRNCDLIIQYHTREQVRHRGQAITFVVSEYVEGEVFTDYLKRQRGKRIPVFEGVHLLYELMRGLEQIHSRREYHGDLHPGNIIVRRQGLGFNLKILDFFHHGKFDKELVQTDIWDSIKIFYDAIGGRKHYAKQPQVVKNICCGLKRGLIEQKFRTAAKLRSFLENMEWE